MELTQKQTDKILKKLNDTSLEIIDTEPPFDIFNINTVGEEYFNEKVNEALEK